VTRTLLLLLLAGSTLLSACGDVSTSSAKGQGPAAPLPAVKVSVGQIERRNLPELINVSGTFYADEDILISAKQAGRVLTIAADVGDVVASGSTLAQIDPVDFELAVQERESASRAVLAQIGLEALPGEDFDPSNLPAVTKARAESDNAKARYERAKRLSEQTPPLIAEQDFADIRTQWEVANNQAAVELLAARAALASARAQISTVATAQQRLADTTIKAPMIAQRDSLNFRIAERMTSPGEYLQAGAPMFRVVADGVIKYRVLVPDRYSGKVKDGQEVELRGDVGGGIKGTVSRISPVVNPTNRNFLVEIEIANAEGALKAGAFAEGRIIVGDRPGSVLVPTRAIVTFAGIHRVYTVADGKAQEHRVRLGLPQGELTEVIGENITGDQVITSGLASISPGSPVEIEAK
jgi:RND family efflux transporter MFP subunit